MESGAASMYRSTEALCVSTTVMSALVDICAAALEAATIERDMAVASWMGLTGASG
jgi:hypothetical protein